MEKVYPFPVWGTQGGGLAEKKGGQYYFIEAPNCPGLEIGDQVPDEWDLAPARGVGADHATEEK